MKKTQLTLILVLLINATFSQTSIILEKGNKTIELDQYSELTFFEEEIMSNGDSIIKMYNGQLSNVFQDSITITPSSKQIDTYYTDKRSLQNTFYYFNDSTSKLTFGKNNLYQINTFNSNLNEITTYISIISAFTALIVSPLISFNYKNKTFDTNRYAYVTGVSLATFTVSLSINITLSYKKFKLKGNNNFWTIK